MPLKKLHLTKSCVENSISISPTPHMVIPRMVGSRDTFGALQRSEGPANIEDITEIPDPGGGGIRRTMEHH